jgi:hypothetical protein
MLKAFKLEENPRVYAKGLFLQRQYRCAADMLGDSPACVLNFSA